MKVGIVVVAVLSVMSACYGDDVEEEEQGEYVYEGHPNTDAQGCIDDVCGTVCSYNGMQIFPGQTYELPGKCIIYECSEDFTVFARGCDYGEGCAPVIGRDVSKPYPECCGTVEEVIPDPLT